MSFMLLKVRSKVAVVSTIKMAANLARLEKEVYRADSTCCKELFLWCKCISRRKSFQSDSVSSGGKLEGLGGKLGSLGGKIPPCTPPPLDRTLQRTHWDQYKFTMFLF